MSSARARRFLPFDCQVRLATNPQRRTALVEVLLLSLPLLLSLLSLLSSGNTYFAAASPWMGEGCKEVFGTSSLTGGGLPDDQE